jgi:hypothetical protein
MLGGKSPTIASAKKTGKSLSAISFLKCGTPYTKIDKSFLTKSDFQTYQAGVAADGEFLTALLRTKNAVDMGSFLLSYSIGSCRYIEVKESKFFFCSKDLLAKFVSGFKNVCQCC